MLKTRARKGGGGDNPFFGGLYSADPTRAIEGPRRPATTPAQRIQILRLYDAPI